jgi:hypothetical protein
MRDTTAMFSTLVQLVATYQPVPLTVMLLLLQVAFSGPRLALVTASMATLKDATNKSW